MRTEDRRQEFLSALGRACYALAIGEAVRELSEYVSAIEDLDGEMQHTCKKELARKGLKLEQKLLPRLHDLATKILDAAGAKAIRDACEPIQRLDRQGRPETFTWTGTPMPPLPSEFVVPERFRESVVGELARKLVG